MSLRFGAECVTDWENVCRTETGEWHPVTQTIVHATMAVGIGRITDDNASEFFARCRLLENTAGSFMSGPRELDLKLTPEDIQRHIGLWTNVKEETRTQWVKRVIVGEHGVVSDLVKFYDNQIAKAITTRGAETTA